ncbi:MAG: PEGA domain-containing protein [Acidobacteriota bacterium]|nr:PEGA domain-containing protein [Acidobacteriota bacterium]
MIGLALAVVLGLWPAAASAQRRAEPRGDHDGGHVVVVGGGYIGGAWGPWGPWGPYWGPWGPWGYPPYPPYYYVARGRTAHLKTEVKPKNTQIYVDGYYAGIADDFDGIFQSLSVRPGPHEVTLYLNGFKAVHQQLYLSPDSTTKLRHVMQPLAPGEAMEPPPSPAVPPVTPQTAPPGAPGPETAPPPVQGPPPSAAPEAPATAEGFGTITIRVQPSDATVLIDGEPWAGPAGADRLSVQVAAGAHHIDIRKSGYRAFSIDVQVEAGATVPLNVSLPPLQ